MGDHPHLTAIPEQKVRAVIRLAHHAGSKDWVPATSGNFSVRIDDKTCAITASGGDKARLAPGGVIATSISGPSHPRASAEAPLHYMLYRLRPEIAAVAHVHAQSSVLASLLLQQAGEVRLEGLEMLKAFGGFKTHESHLSVPVFDNTQDMGALSERVAVAIAKKSPIWGFLLAGHGLYAWGGNFDETIRHLDAFDYLFTLSLRMKGIPI
ncbi:MAG: methylthioribulose 1-phosphate dehydratase [Micropepsaceae bacterium]